MFPVEFCNRADSEVIQKNRLRRMHTCFNNSRHAPDRQGVTSWRPMIAAGHCGSTETQKAAIVPVDITFLMTRRKVA